MLQHWGTVKGPEVHSTRRARAVAWGRDRDGRCEPAMGLFWTGGVWQRRPPGFTVVHQRYQFHEEDIPHAGSVECWRWPESQKATNLQLCTR